MESWLIAVAVVAASLFVAWLNNGKKLMDRVNTLTDRIITLQDSEIKCRHNLSEMRSELTAANLQISRLTERINQLESPSGKNTVSGEQSAPPH